MKPKPKRKQVIKSPSAQPDKWDRAVGAGLGDQPWTKLGQARRKSQEIEVRYDTLGGEYPAIEVVIDGKPMKKYSVHKAVTGKHTRIEPSKREQGK